ncbi:hypothetical protein AwDysgo_00030 [Bacteroidales bacterium]|nr:hypothetical protein AwDysgo_00030 [Bacteroidales bacterium]
MRDKYLQILKDKLSPYKGILYFAILLLGSNFLWKICVDGQLHSQQIAIFGVDMTSHFYKLSQLTTKLVFNFVRLFPNTETFCINNTLVYFPDGKIKLNLIWGCTGVKQLYIFTLIILFSPGAMRTKIWYIPLGCIILLFYNIARISAIAFLTRGHPERFDFLHEGLFRYIYYGLIFVLWVIWEEKYSKRKKKQQETQ